VHKPSLVVKEKLFDHHLARGRNSVSQRFSRSENWW